MGQQGPPSAKKKDCFKNDPGPHGMPKQVFLVRFELMVAVLALLKSQNALNVACFGTKNGSKMGQKWVFPKMMPHHLGCLNK